MFVSVAKGLLQADGTEQVVGEFESTGRLSGFIDLSQMQEGDSTIIQQYIDIGDGFKRYWQEGYSNYQLNPVLYINPKESASSIRLTLRQVSGVNRNYRYALIAEVAEIIWEGV